MPTIQLKAMTRELCHELYKHWTNDASIYMDMHLFQPYVYDEAAVNRYFDMKGQDASRRLFAIMLGDKVIGELQLKQIDHDKKECSLSIHMQNDAVKGRGYGTQAERLAVKTAFDELGMAAVNADTIRKNTWSQHVLGERQDVFPGTSPHRALATLGHLSQRERQGMLARYTERCIDVRPLSVRQIGVYRSIR